MNSLYTMLDAFFRYYNVITKLKKWQTELNNNGQHSMMPP